MPSWHRVATLLAAHRDVLDGRPGAGEAPSALVDRGWAHHLLELDDATLDAIEAGEDAAWPNVGSLRDFVAEVRMATRVPVLATEAPRPARPFEKPRKRAQIDAFAQAIVPLAAAAARVVDVGSGHGHLTRELADRFDAPVLGLERDPALAARARALAAGGAATFAVTDVLTSGLALEAGDCVVGLHACGELADAMTIAAARAGAAVALVACCLQKRRPRSRPPLCTGAELGGAALAPDALAALDLPKAMLGLSNLSAASEGVEASRRENVRGRERRLALHRLLGEAGVELPLGAELEGLNRRSAHATLDALVARAFRCRGLALPSPAAIVTAERWARVEHGRMRRLALPRSLLARAVEVFALLDRARYLEARGFDASVVELFPADVSARNLALFARPVSGSAPRGGALHRR